jgi:hypothetical protein
MKCMPIPPKGSSDSEFLPPSACALETDSLVVCAAVPQLHIPFRLSGSAPDALEVAILLCEPVQAVIALAHGADEAAEGVDLVVASVTAVLVNLGDGDLNRCVVLGLDDASSGRLGGISIAIRGSDGNSAALTHLRGT